ncbi:glutathione S-transferase (plasmid) [Phenylobacterium zucineum HLK1]|jgi:glutathione S-transferase|uniref:Glutathione S-transferase n=2 Tax=Phenylobacterium TaxID=20 RepID=B4RIQ2_PHEZH|nr:glutathione transferase GstA [Phenylobacterium zucineum]ACG80227.1 glutathione S-transferase [Phenylobacterium zucineum HLK1]MBJ7412671.1 glutathione transferase GstA [Phenylobacterium sp.]
MKLYYAPGACSLAPHIVIREADLSADLERVDLAAKKTEHGDDFRSINPKGYVPALKLDDGPLLTENAAILQYLGDRAGEEAGLIPAAGTIERYRLIEWLTFVSTELHKGFSPLFNPAFPDEARKLTRAKLAERLGWLNEHFADHEFLHAERFSVADAYLFTVLSWTKRHAIDLQPYPNVKRFQNRIAERPAVQKALGEEGLLEQAAA